MKDDRNVDIGNAFSFMNSQNQFYPKIQRWMRATLGYVPRTIWGPRDSRGDNAFVNVKFRNPTDALLFRMEFARHWEGPVSENLS